MDNVRSADGGEDSKEDIAVRADNEKMRVQAPGRQALQRVFMRTEFVHGRKKESQTTNRPYRPDIDGPGIAGRPPVLPSVEELTPGMDTVEYLEVGLVIGDNPEIRIASSTDKGKKQDKEAQQLRGIMNRHPSTLRAFIPVTAEVASQAKLYVGVRPVDGVLTPRTISGDCILLSGVPGDTVHGGKSKATKEMSR